MFVVRLVDSSLMTKIRLDHIRLPINVP